MSRYNSNSQPNRGEQIDAWDRSSKYLVKITVPNDICVAFNKYSMDFYNASHTIASNLLETNCTDISKLDTYLFPLAFLYRHSIELKLKAIAFQTITQDTARSSFVKETYHNLAELLNSIETISPTHRPMEEVQWLKKYFLDISKVDKKSDSFRYPFHIKISKSFNIKQYTIEPIFNKQIHIDLVKFANKFVATYEILDKWYNKSVDKATLWKELEPVFIEEGGFYYGQSVVGYEFSRDDFYPYKFAYLEIASYLRRYMEEQTDLENGCKASGLFIPMCYLYRNCVELSLKTIWFKETGEDFQKRCKSMIAKKHSIIGMWHLIKPYVESNATEDSEIEYIDTIEKYCQQLHSIDCDSSTFRYPVKKDMTPYFKKNKRFDFLHTGIFLESLNNGLDNIYRTLNIINEHKAEMEYEYHLEMQSDYDYF